MTYFVQTIGENSSSAYPEVLDMCGNNSTISDAFYLTPGFPTGFNGTGSCMCTALSADGSQFQAVVGIEHLELGSNEVCNEALYLSEIMKDDEHIIDKCSPYQPTRERRHTIITRGITVVFNRKFATISNRKTVVWLTIEGKLTDVKLFECIPTVIV